MQSGTSHAISQPRRRGPDLRFPRHRGQPPREWVTPAPTPAHQPYAAVYSPVWFNPIQENSSSMAPISAAPGASPATGCQSRARNLGIQPHQAGESPGDGSARSAASLASNRATIDPTAGAGDRLVICYHLSVTGSAGKTFLIRNIKFVHHRLLDHHQRRSVAARALESGQAGPPPWLVRPRPAAHLPYDFAGTFSAHRRFRARIAAATTPTCSRTPAAPATCVPGFADGTTYPCNFVTC